MPRDFWGFGNKVDLELPSKDMGTSSNFLKLKQKVYRTSSYNSPSELQELLDDGWKVILATQLSNEMIEYILEKYV